MSTDADSAPAARVNPEEANRLAEAFRAFNEVSAQLSNAYESLQGRVEQLTAELAEANGELRRQYQEKAELSERLSTLLNALPAAVLELDEGERVRQANPAAQALFGGSLEHATWQQLDATLAATDAAGEREYVAGGEVRRLVLSQAGLGAGARLVLLHDITRQHELKMAAARNERLAAMGEMAAAAAHQLRTPIAAALLYAGLLDQADLGEAERRRYGAAVKERLRHLERLIRDTLLFARGQPLARESFTLGALAADAAQSIAPLAQQRSVRFLQQVEAPEACLHGDRKALAGALVNLLENALQAVREQGCVRLVLQAGAQQFTLSVADDGCGIDATLQDKLFQPFYTTRGDGTGLGLAIARAVARAHGGDIEVRSQAGAGSVFTIRLPKLEEVALS
ncbi:MAG: PAS domain-containing protein [Rhodocyclaceae bacterium]|nr:PAS domain-containing protein [Rhodocyclaceae bacterium]